MTHDRRVYEHSIRLQFSASNNVAEYELSCDLWIKDSKNVGCKFSHGSDGLSFGSLTLHKWIHGKRALESITHDIVDYFTKWAEALAVSCIKNNSERNDRFIFKSLSVGSGYQSTL